MTSSPATLAIGDTVHVYVDPAANLYIDIAPAIITRVFPEDDFPGRGVNYTILRNGSGEPWAASGRVYASQDEASAARQDSELMAAFPASPDTVVTVAPLPDPQELLPVPTASEMAETGAAIARQG